MPRPGQSRSMERDGLSERIAVGLLLRAFPPELVDSAISSCGRVERRSRLLPARITVYFIVTMCLFPNAGYGRVAALLNEGLASARLVYGPRQVPTTAAISRARSRLGAAPLAALFAEAVRRSRTMPASRTRYRNWTVMTADGTRIALPDSPGNRAQYGVSAEPLALREPLGSRAGNAALPHIHVIALAENGTGAIRCAAFERSQARPAGTPAQQLCRVLAQGDLLLADEGVLDCTAPVIARTVGADLLWQVRRSSIRQDTSGLYDGSRLCILDGYPHKVRVIDTSAIDQRGDLAPALLATTILDHRSAPATELAALFQDRWSLRGALATLGPGMPQVLRSRWPEGAEQEIWGHLLVHHAIHTLLYL